MPADMSDHITHSLGLFKGCSSKKRKSKLARLLGLGGGKKKSLAGIRRSGKTQVLKIAPLC
jgi:hypothetical protein